jgi:D-lactate dehydrogenase
MAASSLRPVLESIVGSAQVLDRPIDRVAFAADASVYRLIPRAVVFPRTLEEVQELFRFSHQAEIPLTFRGAGTSLSGQAVTDGILVELPRHWRGVEALDRGARVRVQPGIVGGQVNALLRAWGTKIGPDPASINACTMGGILANNASGMCCGVAQNAYQTLESLVFVLPSGTCIDTAQPDADARFRELEPELARGLLELKAEVSEDAALCARIRRKYRIKNTTGYSLNAFLDYGTPVEIFRNLLIGSEGTLAFIAEAVLRTVPDLPVKVTGLPLFPDLHRACAAIGPLKAAGAAALELLDRASLRSVQDQPGVPPGIRDLPEGAAALLAEFQGARESERADLGRTALEACARLPLLEPAAFTHDALEQDRLWKVRRGIIPSAGALRARGTSVILEDVAFPVEGLADAALGLTELFRIHGYPDATVFGHAKDGNLHFVLTQKFDTPAAVDQYRRFTDDMVRLVVDRHGGSLKAEHGTGRNMAPFVEAEWGPEAVAVMKRLKALADPRNLLNPDVILNPDPAAHLAHLKAMPAVEEEVDRCIECGWCESKCPSRDLTLSPRQRIVVRREIARLGLTGEDPALRRSLQDAFGYMGVDTCAADGLCATACPVAIDTGALVKRLRRESHSAPAHRLALAAARHFRPLESLVRLALRSGHLAQGLAGARALGALTRCARALAGTAIPQWIDGMPLPAGGRLPRTRLEGAAAVYFPSCISRMLGRLPGEPRDMTLPELMVTLARRAGTPVHIMPDPRGVCCGVPFSSKGFADAHRHAVNCAVERFWTWSGEGRLPVVVDASPCAYGLKTCRPCLSAVNQARFDRLTILDAVTFAHDVLLPRLPIRRRLGAVVLHPVCSLVKMELAPMLQAIAEACAERVVIPREAGCCGFAGDRGLLFPELTAAATRREAAEIERQSGLHFAGSFSSSRTCEWGLTRATGNIYRNFLYLLEAATR